MPRKELKLHCFEEEVVRMADNSKGGYSMAVIGGAGSGKTTLIKHLVEKLDLGEGIVFSPFEKQGNYGEHVEIFPEYRDQIVDEFLVERNEVLKEYGPDEVDCRSCLVLEDQLEMNSGRSLERVVREGRYLRISTIMSLQHPLGLRPGVRCGIDYVFLFWTSNRNSWRKIYEYYAGVFSSFDEFMTVYRECTRNYGCLVIHNTSLSDKLEEIVFWYQVPVKGYVPEPRPSIASEMAREMVDDGYSLTMLFNGCLAPLMSAVFGR